MPSGREVVYDWHQTVPDKVKDLWLSAVNGSKFRINAAQMRLHMGFDPNASPGNDLFDVGVVMGHSSYGGAGYEAYITLRATDDVSFFGDEVLHALGHVIFNGIGDEFRAEISSWFTLKGPNARPGAAADWNAGDWPNHTAEAIAEFFKDVYRLPRKNNNRTSWEFNRAKYKDFTTYMSLVTCPPQPA